MSSRSPDNVSRRACLGRAMWWVAAGGGLAALASRSRAECPCGAAGSNDEDKGPSKSPAPAPATQPTTVLRLCADPNNLPFSNRRFEGFEDKIAQIIATDLGLALEYRWIPQRLGFYREALKTGDTNLVMAAPSGFERALTTDPYYRSSYVFVYRKDSNTSYRSFDDPALRSAKIGVPLTGGDNTPPTYALARRNLIDNVTGFPVFDATDGRPGEKIIEAVANGDVDVAIAWGPSAGYFAKRQKVALEVVPVSPAEDVQGDAKVAFGFNICMGVRRKDKALQSRINEAIARRWAEIDKVLDDFDVPRQPIVKAAKQLGHEVWGRVDAVGGEVTAFRVGDRVAMLSNYGYAEYDVAGEREAIRLPAGLEGVPFPGEPLGCAFNIFDRSGVRPGQTVAIVGIGFLGAILTRLATDAGARVLAITQRPFSLDLAKRMGAAEAIVLDDHWRVVNRVAELTGGSGGYDVRGFCDVVIECTGKQWPLDLSAEICGVRGRLVIAGYHQDGPRQVNMQLWNWRGLDVINAHERDPDVYVAGMRRAADAVASGRLDPSPLYTHRFPLERLDEALNLTRERPGGFVKALVTMDS